MISTSNLIPIRGDATNPDWEARFGDKWQQVFTLSLDLSYKLIRTSPVVILVGKASTDAFYNRLSEDKSVSIAQVNFKFDFKLFGIPVRFLIIREKATVSHAIQQLIFIVPHGASFSYGASYQAGIYTDLIWNAAAAISSIEIKANDHFVKWSGSSNSERSMKTNRERGFQNLKKALEKQREAGFPSLKKGHETMKKQGYKNLENARARNKALGFPGVEKSLEVMREQGFPNLKKGNEIRKANGYESLQRGRITNKERGYQGLIKGRETMRLQGFPGTRKANEIMRQQGFPNLEKGRATNRANGYKSLQKGHETMSATAYAKRSAQLSALLNSREVREFLSKPAEEAQIIPIGEPAPRRTKKFHEDAHTLLTSYREDPLLVENLSQVNGQAFYDRYCVSV